MLLLDVKGIDILLEFNLETAGRLGDIFTDRIDDARSLFLLVDIRWLLGFEVVNVMCDDFTLFNPIPIVEVGNINTEVVTVVIDDNFDLLEWLILDEMFIIIVIVSDGNFELWKWLELDKTPQEDVFVIDTDMLLFPLLLVSGCVLDVRLFVVFNGVITVDRLPTIDADVDLLVKDTEEEFLVLVSLGPNEFEVKKFLEVDEVLLLVK